MAVFNGADGELFHERCKRDGWFVSEGKSVSLELRVSLKAVNLRVIHSHLLQSRVYTVLCSVWTIYIDVARIGPEWCNGGVEHGHF